MQKRDSKGRFMKVTDKLNPLHNTRLINNIAIVLDRSGSMRGCWSAVMDSLRNQISVMKTESAKLGQETNLTIIDVGTYAGVLMPLTNINNVNYINYSNANSNTPLNDGMNLAMSNLVFQNPGKLEDDVSFALVVITDGEDNASMITKAQISKIITERQITNRWTIAIHCPYGFKNKIARDYNIPLGNINEWENTTYGAQVMDAVQTRGTSNFYAARASGQTMSCNYFAVDADNFNKRDIKNLAPHTPKHNKVEKEVGIQEFFQDKKIPYYAGMAYYELTKPELVQGYKKLILHDASTGNYYVDGNKASVKDFLGMPSGDVKIDPMNVGKYRIYVQSTSTNRKLVRGTTVLY
jgi:uncharacterized protein YegL